MKSDDWRRRARCVEMDPEIFFPEHSSGTYAAKRVCRDCPVTTDCLGFALSFEDNPFGVFGGTSAAERAKMRGKRRPGRPAGSGPFSHGTEYGYRMHRERGEDPCPSCFEAACRAKAIRRDRARTKRSAA